MHLSTVEITSILDFQLIQFMVLFQDFLILHNLLILILKQKANFALIAILLNAVNLLKHEDLLDLSIALAFLLELLNEERYLISKSIWWIIDEIKDEIQADGFTSDWFFTYPTLNSLGILYPAGLSVETSCLCPIDQFPLTGVCSLPSFGIFDAPLYSSSINLDAGNSS